MTAIWQGNGARWRLLAPSGFPDEAALHSMVEQAPDMLPLAGSPGLVIVGREAPLGGGKADLIAVEPSGRLAIIEVKLARNAEARRAVVAQVLTYAAYLRGLEIAVLEQQVLGRYLRERGWMSLGDAVMANDQQGAFDAADFAAGLSESVASGRFRLVLVLDDAPAELVRLVGYLQSMTDSLLIDLITVAAYDVNGTQVVVPQRVEPEERQAETTRPLPPRPPTPGTDSEGGVEFAASIEDAAAENQQTLRMLHAWAVSLENAGLARLKTRHDTVREWWTLRPVLRPDDAGFVTLWNDGSGYITPWRSVFERRAPQSLVRVEAIIAPEKVGKGNVIRAISAELLDCLTDAYREAASGNTVTLQE